MLHERGRLLCAAVHVRHRHVDVADGFALLTQGSGYFAQQRADLAHGANDLFHGLPPCLPDQRRFRPVRPTR